MPLPDIRQAATMIEEGRIEPARTVLQNILHKVPSHLSARVLLARILEAEGDHAAALTMWKQAALHGPGISLIENGLREALLRIRFGAPVPIEPMPPGLDTAAAPASVIPQAPPAPAPEFQDLDKLIHELETASIVPDPDIPMIAESDLESDIEDAVTETLARIYANQSYWTEAAQVYEKLAVQHPERKAEFLQRAREMKEKGKA
jgi:tetratricopeptide (TPR) repeat protein